MKAFELQNSEIELTDILADPDNKRLFIALKLVSDALSYYGLEVRMYSRKSILKLPEISADKKDQISSYFENYAGWISPEGTETFRDQIDFNLEWIFIKRALNHFNVHVDQEFMQELKVGHFVEIYGADMVQIYRSINFFEVCGYSLLDLSVFEWYTLWERPRMILDRIASCIDFVIKNPVSCQKFDVPKHILRETYDTGLTQPFIPRTSLAEFINIASVKDGSGKPAGFICTARGHVVSEGTDALAIDFV